jgi:tetratricopeptide (TPR) repeat protein
MRGAAGHVFSFALSAAIALGAVLSSLVASPLAAQDADRRARAADFVVLGERFAQAGDRVSARAYFRDAISADPSYATAYVALGELELARAAYRDAEATFRVGILRAHAEARLWVGLARALDALEAPADADAVLAQADAQLRGDPDLLAFCVARAERRGRWSLALSITRRLAVRAVREGDAERAAALRARARALAVLVGGLDPVGAPSAAASLLRQSLAGEGPGGPSN